MMGKDDFSNDFFGDESTYSRTPPEMNSSLFRERTNPEKEIFAFKYSLMGVYPQTKKVIDEDGEEREVTVLKKIQGFTPPFNKQGVEELTNYLRSIVNTHTIQGNFSSDETYNNRMKFMFNRLVSNMLMNKRYWSEDGKVIPLRSMVWVYEELKRKAMLILTRPIRDAERIHGSETVKETIQTNKSPVEKTNLLQRAAGILK